MCINLFCIFCLPHTIISFVLKITKLWKIGLLDSCMKSWKFKFKPSSLRSKNSIMELDSDIQSKWKVRFQVVVLCKGFGQTKSQLSSRINMSPAEWPFWRARIVVKKLWNLKLSHHGLVVNPTKFFTAATKKLLDICSCIRKCYDLFACCHHFRSTA